MWRFLTPVLLLPLAGCPLAPGYEAFKVGVTGVIDQTIEERKDYNDLKRDSLLQAACDISIGSYARLEDQQKKAGIDLLCGTGKAAEQPILVISGTGADATVRSVEPTVGAPTVITP